MLARAGLTDVCIFINVLSVHQHTGCPNSTNMLAPVSVAAFCLLPRSLPYLPVSVAYSNATGWAAVVSLGDHAARRRHRDSIPGTVALVAVCMPAGLAMRGGSASAIGVRQRAACDAQRVWCAARGRASVCPAGVTRDQSVEGPRLTHTRSRKQKKQICEAGPTSVSLAHIKKKMSLPAWSNVSLSGRVAAAVIGTLYLLQSVAPTVRSVFALVPARCVCLDGDGDRLTHTVVWRLCRPRRLKAHVQGTAERTEEGRGAGGLGPSTTRPLLTSTTRTSVFSLTVSQTNTHTGSCHACGNC